MITCTEVFCKLRWVKCLIAWFTEVGSDSSAATYWPDVPQQFIETLILNLLMINGLNSDTDLEGCFRTKWD